MTDHAYSITETPTVTETPHPNSTPQPLLTEQTLRRAVEQTLSQYFKQLEGIEVTDVYGMVLAEVEAPLLATVMQHVNGNQTRASSILGLNRGTLRKKLKQYDLL